MNPITMARNAQRLRSGLRCLCVTALGACLALSLATTAFAQSIIIPTIAVVKGDTTEIPLEFVAGGGATNFDFIMEYNPVVVDEFALSVMCTTGEVGLSNLDCTIDTAKNQIKGIGTNLPLTPLSSGIFAIITLPTYAEAPSGESAASFTANFASASSVDPFDITWAPKVNEDYCNILVLSGEYAGPDEMQEACEVLIVDSGFTASSGASVMLSSGLYVELMPGSSIELGATLNAATCGQSLCEVSNDPMPMGCHSCAVEICDVDPSCCDTAFTQACVDKVNTVCGLVCE